MGVFRNRRFGIRLVSGSGLPREASHFVGRLNSTVTSVTVGIGTRGIPVFLVLIPILIVCAAPLDCSPGTAATGIHVGPYAMRPLKQRPSAFPPTSLSLFFFVWNLCGYKKSRKIVL